VVEDTTFGLFLSSAFAMVGSPKNVGISLKKLSTSSVPKTPLFL
jgi:hypothetical protein